MVEPTVSIEPSTVEPQDSYTFTVEGFIDGGDRIYIEFLSGPPDFGDYPNSVYSFPGANGSYTTNAPWCRGTYTVRAKQGTLLSNIVTLTVGVTPPVDAAQIAGVALAVIDAILVGYYAYTQVT
jgi:hypothetical protein